MSPALRPHPASGSDHGALEHPSMSNLSDFDAALALAGIRSTTTTAGERGRGPDAVLRSVAVPGHRFGYPRRRTWRNRRRQAGLGASDQGSATLLNAHRQGLAESPPPAA